MPTPFDVGLDRPDAAYGIACDVEGRVWGQLHPPYPNLFCWDPY